MAAFRRVSLASSPLPEAEWMTAIYPFFTIGHLVQSTYHLSLILSKMVKKKRKSYWLTPGFEPRRWPLTCKLGFKAQSLQGLKPLSKNHTTRPTLAICTSRCVRDFKWLLLDEVPHPLTLSPMFQRDWYFHPYGHPLILKRCE